MTRKVHLMAEEHDAHCRWAHQFAVDAGAVAGIVLRSYGVSDSRGEESFAAMLESHQ